MKTDISLNKRIKFQKARKFYLDDKSGCYLSAPKALEKAGYAVSTAKTLAPMLFEQSKSTPAIRLDPENMSALVVELNKWLSLMSKWREALDEVEDPLTLPPKVFAIVSTHIERLSKIIGLVKEQTKGPVINIQINTLPTTEQYEKLKFMLSVLFEKMRTIEGQLEIDASKRFNLN